MTYDPSTIPGGDPEPIEPTPEHISRLMAAFLEEHGRLPTTDAEYGELYRRAQAETLIDLFAVYQEHDGDEHAPA